MGEGGRLFSVRWSLPSVGVDVCRATGSTDTIRDDFCSIKYFEGLRYSVWRKGMRQGASSQR
jgi:hypothetical protein